MNIAKKPSGAKAPGVAPYMIPQLSRERRVEGLFTRMTLQEKAAQMVCVGQEKAQKVAEADGNVDTIKAKSSFQGGVVQMYIRDLVSPVTRPVKEDKGFERVFVKPGETNTVELDITPESLSFWNIDMKYVVEPGDFEIMIGTSSRDSDLQKVVLQVI